MSRTQQYTLCYFTFNYKVTSDLDPRGRSILIKYTDIYKIYILTHVHKLSGVWFSCSVSPCWVSTSKSVELG